MKNAELAKVIAREQIRQAAAGFGDLDRAIDCFEKAVIGRQAGRDNVEFYNPDEYPTRVSGEDFSVDVFILDETGVHGIAFWNFDDEVWRFHTDTLVDYNEEGAETKWKWYYPPFEAETVFK